MNHLIWSNGEQCGPYSFDELETMWCTGSLPVDAQYWKDGMTEWQLISSLFSPPEPSAAFVSASAAENVPPQTDSTATVASQIAENSTSTLAHDVSHPAKRQRALWLFAIIGGVFGLPTLALILFLVAAVAFGPGNVSVPSTTDVAQPGVAPSGSLDPDNVSPREQAAPGEQTGNPKDPAKEAAEDIAIFGAYIGGVEAGTKYGASRGRIPTTDELDAWADMQMGALAYSPDESVTATIPKIKAALKRGFAEGYKKATAPAF